MQFLQDRWSPEVLPNGSLGYPIGLQFRVIQAFEHKMKADAMIVKTRSNENLFHALFDQSDVDFEIGVKNSSKWDVKCTIKVGNSRHCYIIPKFCDTSMKALESCGKHLHFVSQDTSEGKLLVAMNARVNGVTYEEAAVNCSRIEFGFALDESHDGTYTDLTNHMKISKGFMEVNVKISHEKVITFKVEPSYTVSEFKMFITMSEGIPPDQQRLIFDGKQLEDGRTLADYNVKHGSSFRLELRMRGGGYPDQGSRGVVCFGQQTNQQFAVNCKKFVDSKIFSLEPFTVEMRTKPRLSLTP